MSSLMYLLRVQEFWNRRTTIRRISRHDIIDLGHRLTHVLKHDPPVLLMSAKRPHSEAFLRLLTKVDFVKAVEGGGRGGSLLNSLIWLGLAW